MITNLLSPGTLLVFIIVLLLVALALLFFLKPDRNALDLKTGAFLILMAAALIIIRIP